MRREWRTMSSSNLSGAERAGGLEDVTFSADRGPRAMLLDPLPPALPAMWRLCVLGYRHEPTMMLWAFSLALLAALPDALIAYWLKLLGDGAIRHDIVEVLLAAVLLGGSAAGTWLL